MLERIITGKGGGNANHIQNNLRILAKRNASYTSLGMKKN